MAAWEYWGKALNPSLHSGARTWVGDMKQVVELCDQDFFCRVRLTVLESCPKLALQCKTKEAHDGKLTVADWRVTVVSSHRGAQSRQVKEVVSISNEGVDNLLNSKMEFGANNLTEITVKQGFNVVGAIKRRREEEEKAELQHQQQQQLPRFEEEVQQEEEQQQ